MTTTKITLSWQIASLLTLHPWKEDMLPILARVLSGICGAVVFAFINRWTSTLSGEAWWVALAAIFVAFFFFAALIEKFFLPKKADPVPRVIACDNDSDANQEIIVKPQGLNTDGVDIASRNSSHGDQKINVG